MGGGGDLLCRSRGGYLQLGLEGKMRCRSRGGGGGDLLCRCRRGIPAVGSRGGNCNVGRGGGGVRDMQCRSWGKPVM